MKNTKRKLTCTTPFGVFTRTTDHPYKYVSIFGIPDAKIYEAEIARVTRKGTDAADFIAHCKKHIAVAEENANNKAYVSEVKWHKTRKSAEAAKATWTYAVKVAIAEVDGSALESENTELPEAVIARLASDEAEILSRRERADNTPCAMCGEGYDSHRPASGNKPPFCMAKASVCGDTFVNGGAR